MAHRHLSRSIALQSLFEWDFRAAPEKVVSKTGEKLETVREKIDDILKRNIEEFGEDGAEKDFITKLTKGVLKNRDTLDEIIAKAARDWPLNQTPLVDRNVLRIGLYELLYAKKDEVPARVAINEAIELAKSFGGERSGKFINGVLGTIYKEMGEPGKDEEPKKKRKYKKKEDLTAEEKEKLPLKKLVGAVVFCIDKKGNESLAFVHDVFGYWTLSKGGVEDGEDENLAVVREIKEEMNIDIVPVVTIGVNEYIATDPEIGNMRKRVTYFLAKCEKPANIKIPEGSGGLDGVKWFPVSEVGELKMYPDVRPIIDKGLEALHSKEDASAHQENKVRV